ncbi:MAG: bifunctional (p)ppGpp synthetase/guanosine-3',5'-bis(diphosphate) 3'-pyrophosphohydrolase [Betaproteobacteria bacterium]|nr:bifunctional (p)ppGpp synthetase/guanosine-3',5'-bis(diphosphate) 3'-pyrophosphohydrolase [Betaproteobacteria bacterium]
MTATGQLNDSPALGAVLRSRPRVERAWTFCGATSAATAGSERWMRAQAVAQLLSEIDADDDTLAAGLIAETIDPGHHDWKPIAEAFGEETLAIAQGVLRATRVEKVHAQADSGSNLEQMRKMLLALANDVRVVLILLAARVVALRSMTRAPEAARRQVALLTRDLYAPLANRLGVFQIKWELEDFAFRFLEPELYKRIAGYLDGKRSEREAWISGVVAELRDALSEVGVAVEVMGRPKHLWSIHRKMQSKNLPFEKLYDVRAVRVLVDSIADCYKVLSLVHDRWTPVAGEFDDYIAQPKANNYQSLHTAVTGPEGKTLEVQIRTHAMHVASEHGVAAHWRYKESAKGARTQADKRHEEKIAWLRQVLEWKTELAATGDFSAEVRKALFNDTIYVLTPQDKVIDLPAGSTPVDFSYHVHTDLGHRCRGAKVDGHIVPLNTPLQNTNRVEILAAKQGGPSRDWINPQLGFLASSRAQAKVRAWFRQEYFEVDVAHGRQTLDRELARAGATAVSLEKVVGWLGQRDLDECLAAIGRGEITPHMIEVALRQREPESAPEPQLPATPPAFAGQTSRTSSGVLVLGVNNIATMVAKCCKPLPGDAITGFITKARGVTVHRMDCRNIVSLSPDQRDRLVPAAWGETGDQPFHVEVELVASDRQGLLRDVSEALAHERLNVVAVNSMSRGNVASMRFTLEVRQTAQLDRALRVLAGVKGVESVRRRGA